MMEINNISFPDYSWHSPRHYSSGLKEEDEDTITKAQKNGSLEKSLWRHLSYVHPNNNYAVNNIIWRINYHMNQFQQDIRQLCTETLGLYLIVILVHKQKNAL